MAATALTNKEVLKQTVVYPGLYLLGGALVGLAEKLLSSSGYTDSVSEEEANRRIKEYALLGLGIGLFNSGKSVMAAGANEVQDAVFNEDKLNARYPF